MNYSLRIQLMAVAGGIVYSLGYLFERIRFVIEEQLPFIGIVALFIWGACVGLYAACLIVPTSFLTSAEGKKWTSALSGTSSVNAFRRICWTALSFFMLATFAVLYYAFVFMQE